MKRVLLIIVMTFIGMNVNYAQEYKANVSNSKLYVSGTSTLHDWECNVKDFQGKVNAVIENGKLVAIKSFDFSFKVKSLDSGKSAMDKKTFEALKEEKYPTISYKGDKVTLNNGKATFYGQMYIAGVSKSFETSVDVNLSNGVLTLKGAEAFKLATFDIEPPTAMFGTIKTGEEVSIHYDLQLTTK
ncbi:YceI-like domain-containing protein [Pustulibacterium marinum]|uniref:YceI-like domain-containing protein n=1 Tax=Pustulibacterium marinum TaxID=1224947 RepID=A0A1I7GQ84_9FLAO|nr:YceI family protein [Pustulibacterium marinum]SFU50511.1 YceI-like domain-containing protein [Pustulibacterium marinum]